jgi:hypothetical protein
MYASTQIIRRKKECASASNSVQIAKGRVSCGLEDDFTSKYTELFTKLLKRIERRGLHRDEFRENLLPFSVTPERNTRTSQTACYFALVICTPA